MQLRDKDFSRAGGPGTATWSGHRRQPDLPMVLKGASASTSAMARRSALGESGSGKSVTSLATMGWRCQRARWTVRSGQIMLKGQDLLALSEAQMKQMRARDLAMIFQEPMTALNLVLKVGAQIMEVLDLHTRLAAPKARQGHRHHGAGASARCRAHL